MIGQPDAALAAAIAGLHPLPSPRGAALELLRLAGNDLASVDDVARVAQADPALAGRLIRVANSSAYRGARSTGSIRSAVLRLGLASTRQIALAFSLLNEHRRGACQAFDYQGFWSRSLLRALAARAIAARLRGGEPHEALACALLAEIGRLALATAQPAAYGELLLRHGQGGAALRLAESAQFGIDHAGLGLALLAQWKLPASQLDALRAWFAPSGASQGLPQSVLRLSRTLVLAEALARALSAPVAQLGAWTHVALQAAERLSLDAPQLDELVATLEQEAQGWAPMLELPAPVLAAPGFAGYGGSADARPDGAGLRILLVEDDEFDALLIRRALEQAGHRVQQVHDGREALASIAISMPQLVITDIDMPGMNGLAFCRSLRDCSLGLYLHVIALTGRARHEDMVECIAAGANDFVTKEALPDAVLARVRAAQAMVLRREALHDEIHSVRTLATGLALELHKEKGDAPPPPRKGRRP
jgi:two-component system cell cycle response regulator